MRRTDGSLVGLVGVEIHGLIRGNGDASVARRIHQSDPPEWGSVRPPVTPVAAKMFDVSGNAPVTLMRLLAPGESDILYTRCISTRGPASCTFRSGGTALRSGSPPRS